VLFDRPLIITFRVSRKQCKCILVMCVCVSVSVSVPRHILSLLHGPGCKLGEWWGCPLVVHNWADFQSVHGFRCYDNIALNVKRQLVLVLALCLIHIGVDLCVAYLLFICNKCRTYNKRLSYHRGIMQRALSVEILSSPALPKIRFEKTCNR